MKQNKSEFDQKKYIFDPLQGENSKVISKFFRLLFYHEIASILVFISVFFSNLFLKLSFGPFFSDLIPSIYRGKSLIIESSSQEFYNISGVLYFIIISSLIIFSLFYISTLLKYKISIKINRYNILNNIIIIIFVIGSFLVLRNTIFGPVHVTSVGIIQDAIYRGNFLTGVLLPAFVCPIVLFVIFTGPIFQFFILNSRSRSRLD